MITWPDEIVQSAARRKAVFFLGSGVSRNSVNAAGQRPPLWEGFLNSLIPHCEPKIREIKSYMRANDYLTACELIRARLGDQWETKLEECFLSPHFNAAEIHKAIFKLDLSIILTTNVDQIYDRLAQYETQNFVRIKHYYDDDVGRAIRGSADQRLILKVHGCVSTPHRAIFTRAQYANAVAEHASFYRLLEAIIATHTVVFVGCGLADPDINLLLEKNSRAFASTPPHYMVTSTAASEDLARMYKNNYNLKIIKYRPNDNHKELLESLSALALSVEEKRDDIANSRLW